MVKNMIKYGRKYGKIWLIYGKKLMDQKNKKMVKKCP